MRLTPHFVNTIIPGLGWCHPSVGIKSSKSSYHPIRLATLYNTNSKISRITLPWSTVRWIKHKTLKYMCYSKMYLGPQCQWNIWKQQPTWKHTSYSKSWLSVQCQPNLWIKRRLSKYTCHRQIQLKLKQNMWSQRKTVNLATAGGTVELQATTVEVHMTLQNVAEAAM